MAAYAVQADLARYIDATVLVELADDNNDGAADAGVIDGILEDCSRRIDGALQNAGYAVPVASPGNDLRSLTARLALGPLYGRRREVVLSDADRLLIEQAEAELLAIGKGNLSVTGAVASDPGDTLGGIAVISDEPVGWTVDL
ncbi:MAG: phage protein Gp36 family protein [Acidobacteriota bacterium]